MVYFPYPKEVDKKKFSENSNYSPLYGLPKQVKFCKSCVISNQRPSSTIEFKNNIKIPKQTINFDEKGICDACRVKEKKEEINWKKRENELKELCDKFRK